MDIEVVQSVVAAHVADDTGTNDIAYTNVLYNAQGMDDDAVIAADIDTKNIADAIDVNRAHATSTGDDDATHTLCANTDFAHEAHASFIAHVANLDFEKVVHAVDTVHVDDA